MIYVFTFAGACIVLAIIYFLGKKIGRQAESNERAEDLLESVKDTRDVYNMSDDDLTRRMQDYGDK